MQQVSKSAEAILTELLRKCFTLEECYGTWDGESEDIPQRVRWRFNECFSLVSDMPGLEADLRAYMETHPETLGNDR